MFRYRWLVIAAWAVVLAVSVYFAPRLPGVTAGGGFDTPGSESARAADVMQDDFGLGYRRVIQVLYHDPEMRVDQPRFGEEVQASVERIKQLSPVSGAVTFYDSGLEGLVSPDRHATYAIINFSVPEEEIKPLVPQIQELAACDCSLETYVMGGPAYDYDLEETSKRDLWEAEKVALPAIIIILVLVFGSLVAAGLPALLGGASVTLALALLYLLGQWLDISVFVLNMVTMVGMGLGVDYSLFIVNRFREELAGSDSPGQAVTNTMKTAGRSVVFSGAVVIVGMAMLVLFDFVFMRSLGIGGMIVAAASVVVAVTLLPAVLGSLQRHVNTGRVLPVSHLSQDEGRFWALLSRQVMRRPLVFLVASIAVLVALALPVTGMRAGSPGGNDLSPASSSRQGLDLFVSKWGIGEASPIYIVIRTGSGGGVWSQAYRDSLTRLESRLESDPRVGYAFSANDLDLPGDQSELRDYLIDNPREAARAATVANIMGENDIGLVRVIARTEPSTGATRELVRQIRDDVVPQTVQLEGAEVLVGGSAAEAVDFTELLQRAFPYLVAAVLIITFITLMLLFRSLVLPLKAIFMNMLSVAAAYGVLVLVFQHGYGEGLLNFTATEGIIPFVPVILFSILFGLSMDYEVFLLSRIKEEYDRCHDNETAVTLGLQRTGRIITTAALIMIAVFASFALAESTVIKEFGVGLAVAILLDATLVRVILVPATMKLLGDWNWWLPGWLDRILPDFSLRD